MKTGRTITELAQEIERQQGLKRDFIANTEALNMVAHTGGEKPTVALAMGINGRASLGEDTVQIFPVKKLAHNQLAQRLGIPAAYYDRMMEEAPDLLAANVNKWFHVKHENRMIRTMEGEVRAVLSDRYRPLENYDVAEAGLPILQQLGVEILSCQITESRLYIKAVDRRVSKDVPTGKKMGDGSHVFFDTMSPAIVISNSEVGCGALSVETAIWTKVCTNLAIASQRSMKKYHIGGKHEIGEELYALLTDKTRAMTDAAVFAQVRDVIAGAFEAARFEALIQEVGATAENKIVGDPVKAIEITAKRFGLKEGEQTSILRHLIEGGDLSQYGLFNAVTRTAEDLPDYDRATEFERLGGKIIELPKNDWAEIAEAA